MKTEQRPEQSIPEEQIREALNLHWRASRAGDANAEHDIYDDDAICDYPQSGERILGRSNLQALRSHHPGKPPGFIVKRILGKWGSCLNTVATTGCVLGVLGWLLKADSALAVVTTAFSSKR